MQQHFLKKQGSLIKNALLADFEPKPSLFIEKYLFSEKAMKRTNPLYNELRATGII